MGGVVWKIVVVAALLAVAFNVMGAREWAAESISGVVAAVGGWVGELFTASLQRVLGD